MSAAPSTRSEFARLAARAAAGADPDLEMVGRAAAANELVGQIRDRMPLILAREGYGRWRSDEPDAHELMKSFPAEAMRMWPVSTRVNKPENDDPEVMKELSLDMA